MHIAILGAGRTGTYSAERLSNEGHSVVVVDKDKERLKEVQHSLDVATMQGSASDPTILQELMEDHPEIVFAATDNDNANLVACSLLKQFGNPKTIARIKEPKFFANSMVDLGRLFHVDHLVISELLVAEQIANAIIHGGHHSESFFHGNVLLRSIVVPQGSPMAEKSLAEIRKRKGDLLVGVVHRQKRVVAEDLSRQLLLLEARDDTFFPHGADRILAEDELVLIGASDTMHEAFALFGVTEILPKTVLIAGATPAGIHLAKLLHPHGISVRVVDNRKDRCEACAVDLPFAAVIHQETESRDFLKSEHVDTVDFFVAVTENDETNLLLGLLAHELGCSRVSVVVTDEVSCRLAEKQGISYVISPRVVTIDRIAALVTMHKVNAVVSLYDGKAEVIQAKISNNSPLAGIPLSVLGPKMPKELLFAVIYNRGRIFIASGSHILSPRDEVLVISHPKHRALIEELF